MPSRPKRSPTPRTARPARSTTTSAARTACCSRWSSSGSTSRRPGSRPTSRASSDLDGRLRALWSDSMTPEPDGGDSWLLLEIELWLHAARNAEFAGDLAQRYDDRRAALAAPLAEWAKDEGLGRLRHPQRTSGPRHRAAARRGDAATPRPRSVLDRRRRRRPPSTHRRRCVSDRASEFRLDQIDLLEDTWARGVPHDQFAVLRREAPVYWHEHPNAQGFWAITKHADVKAISHDVGDVLDRGRLGVHPRSGPDGARVPSHDAAADGPAEAQPLPPARVRGVHAADDRDARRFDRDPRPQASSSRSKARRDRVHRSTSRPSCRCRPSAR